MTPRPRTEAAPVVPARLGGPRPLGWPIRFGLALTLVALLTHALSYRFLTDDAFISFRYSHNFAQGHGLVFNPAGERVEGYSNFLWVVLLAALERAGIAPERAANPLSLLATAALWWVVVRFALRHRGAGAPSGHVLIAPAFLAASRSFAVWSTGGLETRLFELLVAAGLIRLADEVDALRAGRMPGPPWGATLLGLAGLTRPDGALVAGMALLAGFALLARSPQMDGGAARLRAAVPRAWPAAVLIGAHHLFRFAYYGTWAPNTYFAKVGGRLKPEAGIEYLTAFVLEYAAFLWLPGLLLAFLHLKRSPVRSWMLIATAALVPHVLYVIAIGGDHFEYRPLDVLFPWVALLLVEGARGWSGTRVRSLAVAAGTGLVLAGMLVLPWRSHVEFPRVYMPGFPGLQVSQGPVPSADAVDADRFLDPDRFALTRLPVLKNWAAAHRRILLRITSYYSGIRQEEHRMFFGVIHGEAETLRSLIQRGLLPANISMAMDCVGAIPYLTGARTLDRLGLTDARVAHQPFAVDLVAHGKQASFEYARERGIDLWFFHPAQLTAPAASSRAMRAFTPAGEGEPGVFVAPLEGRRWLLARFPLGADSARARMPRLHFWNMNDSLDARAARGAAIGAWEARLDSLPRDSEALDALGFLHAEAGDWAAAAASYRALAGVTPADPDPPLNLAACLARLGDMPGTMNALRDAAGRAEAAGDGERLRAIEIEIAKRARAR